MRSKKNKKNKCSVNKKKSVILNLKTILLYSIKLYIYIDKKTFF